MSWINMISGSLLRVALLAVSKTREPQLSGQISFKGLNSKVEILRDRWGIPHIYGQTIKDVVFAQGYVHAQERLWQMDFNRRVLAGRLCEIMGMTTLEADVTLRTLGLRRVAEQEVALIDDGLRDLLECYCAGVNACIAHGRLPIEFSLLGYQPEPWTVADTLSWNKLMFLTLGTSWDSEFLRGQLLKTLGPEKTAELELGEEDAWPLIIDAALSTPYQPGKVMLGTSPRDGAGSNNWVISGRRSQSGMPLLANDMHLGLTSPAIFYQNHLCAEDLNVIGVTFPGVPFVIQGHNGRVAWGFTNGFADVQDLYEEHIRKADGQIEYEYKGKWHPVKTHIEWIKIKGAGMHSLEVLETCHGPLINYAMLKDITPEPPPLAMTWTAFEPRPMLHGLLQMNLAKNCSEFQEALRHWGAPVQNIVFADTTGNIAYTQAGVIPIRAKGDGSIPLPGWSGEHDWIGKIPFDDLPHLYNPARGYVATANNRVAGAEYPYYLSRDYISRDRAQRIIELIESLPLVDLAWMKQMQFDQESPSARSMVKAVGQLRPAEPILSEAVGLLVNWDCVLRADSPAAALYEVLARQTLQLMLTGKLAGLEENMRGKTPSGLWEFHSWEWLAARLEQPDSPWWDLGSGEKRDDVLLLALEHSIKFLKEATGKEMAEWQWGMLHQLTFRHILGRQKQLAHLFNQGPFPVGGDGGTVWASYSSLLNFKSDIITGPPFRFLIDMADPEHAQVIFAPGQSGRPGSPHYGDGIDAWFHAGYHPLLFRRDEIEQATEKRLTFEPVSLE
jgi:penicillin G amidase